MELRHAILTVLRDGHQIEHQDLEIYLIPQSNGLYLVEVHDPLDIETGNPLNPTWSKLTLYKLMGRITDFSQRAFDTPEAAVDFYLAIIEETRQ